MIKIGVDVELKAGKAEAQMEPIDSLQKSLFEAMNAIHVGYSNLLML